MTINIFLKQSPMNDLM